MKTLFGSTLLTVALMFPSAIYAGHGNTGQVQEILVKIETKDGINWYKLGKDLKLIDLKPGDHVDFEYADDTIESITPTSTPGNTPAPQSAPEKIQ